MHVNDETDNELDDSYEADGPSVRTFPSYCEFIDRYLS